MNVRLTTAIHSERDRAISVRATNVIRNDCRLVVRAANPAARYYILWHRLPEIAMLDVTP